jgi:hypothetical protein
VTLYNFFLLVLNYSGDVELGDALISSVEGRANAIEATLLLNSPNVSNSPPSSLQSPQLPKPPPSDDEINIDSYE